MKAFVLGTALVMCAGAFAQEAAKAPDLTAEQILDKSIDASGGKAAHEKITSTVAKGTVDITFAPGASATTEIYAKAPNKRLTVTVVDGYGEIRQGFDGTIGWSEDPQGGLRDLSGDELEQTKRSADIHAALKWREIYPKVELKGKEKVNNRDAYVVILTPKTGKTVTQFIDAETFLPSRVVTTVVSPQGEFETKTELADYRDVDGIKVPFQITQTIPMGDLIIKFTEMKNNVPVDDAKFVKPSSK